MSSVPRLFVNMDVFIMRVCIGFVLICACWSSVLRDESVVSDVSGVVVGEDSLGERVYDPDRSDGCDSMGVKRGVSVSKFEFGSLPVGDLSRSSHHHHGRHSENKIRGRMCVCVSR